MSTSNVKGLKPLSGMETATAVEVKQVLFAKGKCFGTCLVEGGSFSVRSKAYYCAEPVNV